MNKNEFSLRDRFAQRMYDLRSAHSPEWWAFFWASVIVGIALIVSLLWWFLWRPTPTPEPNPFVVSSPTPTPTASSMPLETVDPNVAEAIGKVEEYWGWKNDFEAGLPVSASTQSDWFYKFTTYVNGSYASDRISQIQEFIKGGVRREGESTLTDFEVVSHEPYDPATADVNYPKDKLVLQACYRSSAELVYVDSGETVLVENPYGEMVRPVLDDMKSGTFPVLITMDKAIDTDADVFEQVEIERGWMIYSIKEEGGSYCS